MRKLRRFYTPIELRKLYAGTYDSKQWPEHTARIAYTQCVAQALIDDHGLKTLADLSCGDGTLVRGLHGLAYAHLRDYSDNGDDIIDLLHDVPAPVDLFVCTETIEHLEAPWTLLERVAEKTRHLVLSCPLGEPLGSDNYEHYWSFDNYDVRAMLEQSGFTQARTFTVLQQNDWHYSYQLWTAMSEKTT